MHISQVIEGGARRVVFRDGDEACVVEGAGSSYALAQEAIAAGRTLADAVRAAGSAARSTWRRRWPRGGCWRRSSIPIRRTCT